MKKPRHVIAGMIGVSSAQGDSSRFGETRSLTKPGADSWSLVLLMSLLLIIIAVSSFCCPALGAEEQPASEPNPFLAAYDTPFGVPPFNLIKNEHFMPALLEGINQQELAIEAIAGNSEPPTLENTIVALDYSGTLLNQVSFVFYNYLSTISSPELEEIAGEIQPMLAAHWDNISLNRELFSRIQAIYEQKGQLELNEEDLMLLEKTHFRFVQNGASLPEEKQERFREINQALSLLTLQFRQNVLADVEAFKLYIEDEEDLAGLSQAVIAAAREAAAREGREGAWLFTLHNPSVMPFLSQADNRDLRKVMNHAYINRGNHDNEFNNREIINQIVELRIERSQMLGYANYAWYALEDRMAKKPEIVDAFQSELWEAALPIAREEAALLQEMIRNDGHDFELAYWDWRYFADKVRREQYDLDTSVIPEYFELDRVREGLFMIAERLWGVQMIERTDLPRHHPDISTWEVLEDDGTHIGILYMDMHPRTGKRSGAWMSSFRQQHIDRNGDYVHPVISIVANFTPPVDDRPALLSLEEMKDMFHEFGHALHGLFSRVRYPSLSGTAVAWDFVELPSMLMENWSRHPDIRKEFSRHYQTGEALPDLLIERLEAARRFNQGFEIVEILASGLLDFEYHILIEYEPFEVDQFEAWVKKRYQMMEEIYFRHGSTHFQHIFSGGYAAGYYSYLWSEVLSADAFQAFLETGDLFDRETARQLREEILERGGTRPEMEMYIAFRGREPEIEPLLRLRGLLEE